MESFASAPAMTASAGTPAALAGTNEIGELILAEHARILRLFSALDGLIRRGDPTVAPLALTQIWTRTASLLDVHTRAEEEICFPLVSGTGPDDLPLVESAIADHDGMREAVAESRLLEVGSSRWWQVIAAVQVACVNHFVREEQGPLAKICDCPPETSKALVRQWAAFAAAQADDTTTTSRVEAPATAGMHAQPQRSARRHRLRTVARPSGLSLD